MLHFFLTERRIKPAVQRGYGWLLRAYPASFQIEFGLEMTGVFSDLVDEAASQGIASLVGLAAREALHTSAAIFRAYWAQRGSLLRRLAEWFWEFFNGIFQPENGPVEDGRTSWRQVALEASLFAMLGSGLVISTYLPVQGLPAAWQSLLMFLGMLILLAPIFWLLVGLSRGMPRWAFPPLGCSLGYCFFTSLEGQGFSIFASLLAAALVLLALEVFFDRRRSFMPASSKRIRRRLAENPLLLSFGLYGFMPLALVVAFDDAYPNNIMPWLLAAVLGMVAGSVAYSRSRKPFAQAAALVMGVTLALYSAVLDHASFTRLEWFDRDWFLRLWAGLVFLILAPPAGFLLYRILRRLKVRYSARI